MTAQVTHTDWAGAVSAIQSAQSILLIAHVTPDADALGSALAIGIACEELGKRVQISVGEIGFETPVSLNFLPRCDLVVAPENISDSDLVIVCDTASIERLGILGELVSAAPVSIAIDHHATFNGFGSIHLIDSTAPATAAIALELIDQLGVKLSKDIATAIYAGLATDTGSFKFHSTSAETLRMGARLFDAGIDHTTLARKLFDDEPFEALRMLGGALERAQFNQSVANGLGLAYTSIAIDERHGLTELGMERVIESIRRTSEAEVAAVFKQADNGAWKVSLRSKTTVDVGAVAAAKGGGGHFYAAGYTSDKNLADTIADLIEQLDLQGK